ncbi:MAG: sensor histidine kinase, partial [Actinobacteria bacterium]|nr:sensor histidine kinase [Actinomycetota bacterium]
RGHHVSMGTSSDARGAAAPADRPRDDGGPGEGGLHDGGLRDGGLVDLGWDDGAGTAGLPEPAGLLTDDQVDQDLTGWERRRSVIIFTLVTIFLLGPALGALARKGLTGTVWFLFPATLVFVVMVMSAIIGRGRIRASLPLRVVWLIVISGLGCALFAVGGSNWLTALAVVSPMVAFILGTTRLAWAGIAACCAAGGLIGLADHLNYGNTLVAALVPALSGLLAYSAGRREALLRRLRQTRAELARMAVAEERLRISRDLHDLLGHSLSLIALKAELAGRVIGPDPERAAKEIAELETVARRSLTDVRQAVTSYRQPSLAAELAAARRMLASAGVDCRVSAPAAYSLPPAIDALLAWTVREGTTNIVRHAGARRAEIRVEVTGDLVRAELTDDGGGKARGTGKERTADDGNECPAGGVSPAGSGLAGLAERAASLGGTMQAGAAAGGGFRLRVEVPLAELPAGGGRALAATSGPDADGRGTSGRGTGEAAARERAR